MSKNILFIFLAVSILIFGFCLGRFTDLVGSVGGKAFQLGNMVPSLDDLSGQEKKVAKKIIKSSDKVAKAFVKALGKSAKDETRFAKVMESFDKNPARTISLAARQPKKEEDPNKIWKVEPGKVPVQGPEDAPIRIIEFSDFQCPFCAKAYGTINKLKEKYAGKIRHDYVTNILSFHKKAPLAHAAAYAAWEQGKFWEFHDLAYENPKDLTREAYLKWAKELGLNLKIFEKDMSVEKFQEEFDRMLKLSKEVGASGTPTFFVNGRKVRGAKPLAHFVELIDKLLAEGK